MLLVLDQLLTRWGLTIGGGYPPTVFFTLEIDSFNKIGLTILVVTKVKSFFYFFGYNHFFPNSCHF